jgi:hypothetical protein
MNRQGNWWLHALVHYDPVTLAPLLFHRVTGEVQYGLAAPKVCVGVVCLACARAWPSCVLKKTSIIPPRNNDRHTQNQQPINLTKKNQKQNKKQKDELITPPIPHSWSMYFMGYSPAEGLQVTLSVTPLNVTRELAAATPGQECVLSAWAAYWAARTHNVMAPRRPELEAACASMLDAQYGARGAALLRQSGLLANPVRLVVNRAWDERVDGEWKMPRAPLLAVPLNMTDGWRLWEAMNASLAWTTEWGAQNVPALAAVGRRRRRALLGDGEEEEEEEEALWAVRRTGPGEWQDRRRLLGGEL